MKTKLVFLFAAILGLFVMSSCDHNNPNNDKFGATPAEGYLVFEGRTPVITPTMDSLHLVVKNMAPSYSQNPHPIEITYELVQTAGVDPNTFLHRDSQSFTIPAGENTAPLDFAIDQTVQQQILQSAEQIKFSIILKTNDQQVAAIDVSSIDLIYPCTIDPAPSYAGELSAPDIGWDASNFEDYTVTMTEIAPNFYHVDDLFSKDWVSTLTGDNSNYGGFPFPATLIVDPATFEVTVQPENPQLASGGSGFYDPCNDTWTLDIDQTLFGGDPFRIHIELKPE